MEGAGHGHPGLLRRCRRQHSSGGSQMPPAMTQPAHRRPCHRALTEPGRTPVPRRTRARGRRRSWSRRGGERAGTARTPPGRAPQPPGRAGGVGSRRCRLQRRRADAAGQTGDRRAHHAGSAARSVVEAGAGAHWVRQPPMGRREAPGRCSEGRGSPMEGDGEGCGIGGAGMGPAHRLGPRGWRGSSTVHGPGWRAGSPRSLAWSPHGRAAARWRRGDIEARRRRGP